MALSFFALPCSRAPINVSQPQHVTAVVHTLFVCLGRNIPTQLYKLIPGINSRKVRGRGGGKLGVGRPAAYP